MQTIFFSDKLFANNFFPAFPSCKQFFCHFLVPPPPVNIKWFVPNHEFWRKMFCLVAITYTSPKISVTASKRFPRERESVCVCVCVS